MHTIFKITLFVVFFFILAFGVVFFILRKTAKEIIYKKVDFMEAAHLDPFAYFNQHKKNVKYFSAFYVNKTLYNLPFGVKGEELSAEDAEKLDMYVMVIYDEEGRDLAFVKILDDVCQFWSIYIYNEERMDGADVTAIMMDARLWNNRLIDSLLNIESKQKYHAISALKLRVSKPFEYLNVKSYFTPSVEELKNVEKVLEAKLQQAIDDYPYSIVPTLSASMLPLYQRQYVGYVDNRGRKQIRVNCFAGNSFTSEELCSDVIYVHDGGSAFWNVTVDVENEELHSFMVNGVA